MTSIRWDIEVPSLDSTSFPSDVDATAPQAVAVSGAPGSPSAARPGHLLPLPTQTDEDVENAPFPPVLAMDHLANWHSAVPRPYEEPLDGGEAA